MTRTVTVALGLIPLCVFASASQLSGQELRSVPPGRALESTVPPLPMLLDVANAEAEAAFFPRQPEPDSLRRLDQFPGSPDRRCARPDAEESAVRTGDFAIGADIHRLFAGKPAKIWMVPLHDPAPERNGLLVRATRLHVRGSVAADDTVRMVSLAYGYAGGRANPGAFFPSREFTLPKAGEWLVIATSGSDWGCVILRVGP